MSERLKFVSELLSFGLIPVYLFPYRQFTKFTTLRLACSGIMDG